MIGLPAGTRIWIVAGVTDLRRGFVGLAGMVQTALEENPFSGHVLCFAGGVLRQRQPGDELGQHLVPVLSHVVPIWVPVLDNVPEAAKGQKLESGVGGLDAAVRQFMVENGIPEVG